MKNIRQLIPIITLLLLSLQFQAFAEEECPADSTKDRKQTLKSTYPFEIIGTKKQVTLYATAEKNSVILAIENAGTDTVMVKIKVVFDCNKKEMITRGKEIVRMLRVPAKTTISYDTEKADYIVQGCDDRLVKWNISSWSLE